MTNNTPMKKPQITKLSRIPRNLRGTRGTRGTRNENPKIGLYHYGTIWIEHIDEEYAELGSIYIVMIHKYVLSCKTNIVHQIKSAGPVRFIVKNYDSRRRRQGEWYNGFVVNKADVLGMTVDSPDASKVFSNTRITEYSNLCPQACGVGEFAEMNTTEFYNCRWCDEGKFCPLQSWRLLGIGQCGQWMACKGSKGTWPVLGGVEVHMSLALSRVPHPGTTFTYKGEEVNPHARALKFDYSECDSTSCLALLKASESVVTELNIVALNVESAIPSRGVFNATTYRNLRKFKYVGDRLDQTTFPLIPPSPCLLTHVEFTSPSPLLMEPLASVFAHCPHLRTQIYNFPSNDYPPCDDLAGKDHDECEGRTSCIYCTRAANPAPITNASPDLDAANSPPITNASPDLDCGDEIMRIAHKYGAGAITQWAACIGQSPTSAPTTSAPTTRAPTTRTTSAPTTRAPTTSAPTTRAPSTRASSTRAPTTSTPTTSTPSSTPSSASSSTPSSASSSLLTLNRPFNDTMKCESCESCAANSFAMEVAGNLAVAGVEAPKICRVYQGSVKVRYTHRGDAPSNTLLLSTFPSFLTHQTAPMEAVDQTAPMEAVDQLGLVLGIVGGACVLVALVALLVVAWLRRKKRSPFPPGPRSTPSPPGPHSPMLVGSLLKRRAVHRGL